LRKDHLGLFSDQLFGEGLILIYTCWKTSIDVDVVDLRPAKIPEALLEGRKAPLFLGVICLPRHQHADPARAIALLRLRDQRPTGRATGDKRDELAPPHGRPSH
jgi:hypothetical protein